MVVCDWSRRGRWHLATLSFRRPTESGNVEVKPSFGWYESVAYEDGSDRRWLRLDEMMNAVCALTVDIDGHMSGARLGLIPGDERPA
jgi:hypothetical protein